MWVGRGNENRLPMAWPDLSSLGGHSLLGTHQLYLCFRKNVGSSVIWKREPLSLVSYASPGRREQYPPTCLSPLSLTLSPTRPSAQHRECGALGMEASRPRPESSRCLQRCRRPFSPNCHPCFLAAGTVPAFLSWGAW